MNDAPLKIDFHVHTCYSFDSSITLKEVIDYAKRKGLNGVAITDHNTVEGALRLSKICRKTDFIIVPGLEIDTKQAHIVALNINDRIESGMDILEALDIIHEKGGLAVLSHPFSLFKGASLKLEKLVGKIDAVEVMNSCAVPFFLSVYLARRYARAFRIPETAGSDAHIPEVIGLCYSEVYAESDVEDILDAIRKGNTKSFGSGISINKRLKMILKRKRES